MVNKAQFDKIQGLIQSAIDEGATLETGGTGLPSNVNRGYYIKPTVFSGVTRDMRIANEEIFGPVATIMAYGDLDEAVDIANDTEYGLSAVVSGDPSKAAEVAPKLRAGMVAVNAWGPGPGAPFGGYKASGNGREGGLAGLGRQHYGALAGGNPDRGAQAGAGSEDQGGAVLRRDGRAGQLQHLAGAHLRGGMRHGLEIVDQAHVIEAQLRAQLGQRQSPRQVVGDDGAVFQRIPGAGDHAARHPSVVEAQVGEEVLDDVAQAGVLGAGVLAVLQHVDRRAGVAAAAHQTDADVGATDVRRDEGVVRPAAGLCRQWIGNGDHTSPHMSAAGTPHPDGAGV